MAETRLAPVFSNLEAASSMKKADIFRSGGDVKGESFLGACSALDSLVDVMNRSVVVEIPSVKSEDTDNSSEAMIKEVVEVPLSRVAASDAALI